MARYAWSNRVVTQNDHMTLDTDSGPGCEVLADLALDGVYKGTVRLRFFKSVIDSFVSEAGCEFLTFRPAAQAGGGVLSRVINPAQTVSDQTPYVDGNTYPGAVVTADFQVRPNVSSGYVTQATAHFTIVLRPGVANPSTNLNFTGTFART